MKRALWDQATSIIPGGDGLLPKSPARCAPDIWPTYFSECPDVNVTDLDENSYGRIL